MSPEAFAKMLIFEALQRNLGYEWQLKVFQRRYGARIFDDDLEPMPPTVLFRLEMVALDAQQRVKQLEQMCFHAGAV